MAELNEQDREELISYLDGELDEEKSREVEARLTLDVSFRAEADALKQAWGMLDYLPQPEPPIDFTNRTLEKLSLQQMRSSLDHKAPVRRRWGKLAWVAAALLAAGAGLGMAAYLWAPRSESAELHTNMTRYLGVIEKLHLYEHVDEFDFLEKLDHPDLFGEEN
jgi:anti-sigma factor RsiW